MCSSADTLARSIQYRVKEREQRGYEEECSIDQNTIVPVDNIDFLHSYARVFCGKQTSSWHGTTVQAVQPKPQNQSETLTQSSLSEAMDELLLYPGPDSAPHHSVNSSQGENTSTLLTGDGTVRQRHTECVVMDPALKLAGGKRFADMRSPCSSPSKVCRSLAPKMKRRSRTGEEGMSELPGPCSTSLPHPNRQQQHHQTNNLQLQSFQLSHTEQSALKKLRQELDTYIMQKHIHLTDCRPETEQLDHSDVINIQDYRKRGNNCTVNKLRFAGFLQCYKILLFKDCGLQQHNTFMSRAFLQVRPFALASLHRDASPP